MNLVSRFELVLLLIAVAVALSLIAKRLRLPPAAALILGGIALAVIPGMPDIEIDPDLTLVLFLPPLLLVSAYLTNWRDFRADLRIILQLAVGAVLFTTFAVGWVTHLVMPSLPWGACFALGAIVSPPDAVAAKAVLQGLSLPRRIVTLLEGESLVNDATGLVLYRFAVAATLTGTFNQGAAALNFLVLTVGGIILGIALGFVGSKILQRIKEPELGVIASFVMTWASYIAGDRLHVSAVLSTVACGIIVGRRQHYTMTAEKRMQMRAVWGVVTILLESLVFILIGLALRGVIERLSSDTHGLWLFIPAAAAIVMAVIVARFVWIFPGTYVVRAVFPRLRKQDPYPPIGVPVIMSWAGMRGVVSLAAALALPENFPGRDFVLATTFVVILVTVLAQGSTLAPLIKAFHLNAGAVRAASTLSETAARVRIATAELAAVQLRSTQANGTERHPRLVERYTYKVQATTNVQADSDGLAADREEHFATVLAAIAAARETLLMLHDTGEIHETILTVLEHELDLDELGARRLIERGQGV